MKMPRDLIACALWVASIALFVFGAIDSVRLGRNSIELEASLFLAIVALVPTAWCVNERIAVKHRAEIEDVVTIVEQLHHSNGPGRQPRSLR